MTTLTDALHLDDRTAEWMADAACRGVSPGVFFVERGESTAVAQALCQTCPVTVSCLAYALNNRIVHGIWGGTSERTRKRMRRELVLDVREPRSVPHGTQLRYRRGCRCPGCREAASQYTLLLREKAAG